MRNIREILRLRHQAGLSMEKIASACKVSSSTVSNVLSRFGRSGIQWPLPDELDDRALERQLYNGERFKPPVDAHRPDWAWVYGELRKAKYITLHTVWEEYIQEHPHGYGYSWFCESYANFRSRLNPVMRQVHKFGEKCFVDYAGPTFQVIDCNTGEVREAVVFVGVLGGSNYTYAEATWTQELPNWLGSHVRMFEYFGGCPEQLIPDNLKSGVKKANYYEPDVNLAYNDLATHYGVAVLPTRVRKPKDKSQAENGVLLVERWIMAKLRNRVFYSLDDLNEAIAELLEPLNAKAFQKLDGSRKSLFEELEKPRLLPLPAERYYFAQWKKARVNIDYHVELARHYYSVPYQLIHEQVEARLMAGTVEIFYKSQRVCSHRRSFVKGGATTLKEHMPPRHAKMLDWTPERLMNWAEKTGPSTRQLVAGIMERKAHPEQGFRACLGVLRLSNKYGEERVEAACLRAVTHLAFSYQSVKSILERNLDRVRSDVASVPYLGIHHENVRGASYYADSVKEVASC